MADCLKLVVFPGLILLRLEPCDAFGARAYIELQLFSLNFKMAVFLFQRVNARRARRQLRFEMAAFQRQRFDLSLDLSDLLLSILEDEQLFQVRVHERSTY